MSAPKPRIRVVSSGSGKAWFQWYCPCEDEGLPPGRVRAPHVVNFSHADALGEAIHHSRTHTAQRIVEYLEERSWDELDNADRSLSRDRRTGRAYAFAKSAHLIRQHLMKEAR